MFIQSLNILYKKLNNIVVDFLTTLTQEISIRKWLILNSFKKDGHTNYTLVNKQILTKKTILYKHTNLTNESLSFKKTDFILEAITFQSNLTGQPLLVINSFRVWLSETSQRSFSFGFYHLRALVFILFIDACLTDDEPLWEPIEWSLVQTWILFIFSFAWIAENLIVSRYGSYTGRDKRVWFSWYKTFYLIEIYYMINYGVAILFVIVPFYFELNYNLSFIFSWWNWFSRVFFFKFISVFTLIYILACLFQTSVRWFDWKKSLFLVLLINIFIGYLLYTHFIMLFFGYFTDPLWYQKSRPVDYIQLSHEPSRWGWGPAKKDHFTYHNVKTVFWFKNDGPFASSFLLMHQFLFISIFFLYIYWISLFRRIYSSKEVPLTFSTYCVSSIKQFLYCFLMLYLFILASYVFNYQRLPIEFLWVLNNTSWLSNFMDIVQGYGSFLINILTGL